MIFIIIHGQWRKHQQAVGGCLCLQQGLYNFQRQTVDSPDQVRTDEMIVVLKQVVCAQSKRPRPIKGGRRRTTKAYNKR